MEIFTYIWHQYLYVPGFNFLVWVYLNYSLFNFGITIIIVTVLLRILLLPFTVLTEKGKGASRELAKDVEAIKQDYANDPVEQKLMIRAALKKRKIRPWANAIVLSIQGAALLLLYQIFVTGINAKYNMQLLWPGVPRPDFINTKFLSLNLSEHNMFLAGIVAGYIFAELMIVYWIEKKTPSRKEQIFTIFFPAFVFLALALLPSVKSLFVLTSLVFSSIISAVISLIKLSFKKAS